MKIKKIACLFALLIFSMSLFVQTVRANQTDGVRFSLTVLDQTLEDVLSDIEQITGLTLIVDNKIKSDPFSGVYNDVTICEFFSYAFKENNISVSVNSEQSMMTISKIQPSQSSHGDSLACKIDYSNQAQKSVDMPLQQEEFLASEREEPPQAQHSVDMPSKNERRELETVQTDPLTGTTWPETEDQLRLSDDASTSSQLHHEEFLASEADYILKAKQSVKAPTLQERDALFQDPLTGKPWHEVEQQIRPSVHESKSSQLSQADFLAAESDYITKKKMTTKHAQKRDRYEENIDPMSGKNWEEIEAEIK